jgi:hypothetical protein
MHQELPPDAEVAGWLGTLGVGSLCQWDVLFFLYRHQTSLVGSDYLALLLGYGDTAVIDALDVLEGLRLVERSRVSRNVRLYQFTVPSDPPRKGAFERLLDLAGHRAGRLLLAGQLRRPERIAEEGPEEAREVVRVAQQQSRQHENGRQTWRKAI